MSESIRVTVSERHGRRHASTGSSWEPVVGYSRAVRAGHTIAVTGTVGAKPTYARYDLPGGAWRLYGEADGFDHVLVNGQEIVDHGNFTSARPGALLRSGRDTSGTGVD